MLFSAKERTMSVNRYFWLNLLGAVAFAGVAWLTFARSFYGSSVLMGICFVLSVLCAREEWRDPLRLRLRKP